MQHDAIQRTLTHRAGHGADSSAVAAATGRTWHQIADRLVPVIGALGVEALFRRSVHITSSVFPWLAIAENESDDRPLVDLVTAHLAHCDVLTATEASQVLISNFTVLLATLIGESLTESLLVKVWQPSHPPSEEQPR